MRNHYRILGVTPGATEKEVLRAYRTLAKKYHPDKMTRDSSAIKFQQVKEAYEAITAGTNCSHQKTTRQALTEIEKYELVARWNRISEQMAANGEIYSYQTSYRTEPAEVVEFPNKKKEVGFSLIKSCRNAIVFVCDQFNQIKEEIDNAAEKRADKKHRIVTRRRNRIPTSEIYLREI